MTSMASNPVASMWSTAPVSAHVNSNEPSTADVVEHGGGAVLLVTIVAPPIGDPVGSRTTPRTAAAAGGAAIKQHAPSRTPARRTRPRGLSVLHQEQIEDSRHRILKAAETAFAQNSYVATTVDMIINIAGVSRATFYKYFTNKFDVAKGLIDIFIPKLNELFEEEKVPWASYGEFSGFHVFTNPKHLKFRPGEFDAFALRHDELRNPPALVNRLRLAMFNNGVDCGGWPGGPISATHGEEELVDTVDAFRQSLRDLRREGTIEG